MPNPGSLSFSDRIPTVASLIIIWLSMEFLLLYVLCACVGTTEIHFKEMIRRERPSKGKEHENINRRRFNQFHTQCIFQFLQK